MPRPPFPAGVTNGPFPISSGWRGSSWHDVLSVHLGSHNVPGSDTFIGFDDADRLCVTMWAKKGYATRVPLTIVPWLQGEMARDGLEARPNHPLQFRLARGENASRLRDEPVDIQAVRNALAETTGLPAVCFERTPGADLLNLSIDGDGPVILRETAMGRHVAGWMERTDGQWMVATAIIDRQEVEPVEVRWARGYVGQTRPGTAINTMMERVLQRVSLDADLAEHVVRVREADDGPGF